MTRALFALLALSACAPTPPAPSPEGPAPEAPRVEPVPEAPRAETPAGPDAPFASQDDYRQQRADALARLEAAAGTSAQAATACYVAPVGARACGGPASHVVASRESSDSARVADLAARVTALDRRAIAQFDLSSTCDIVIAPPVALRDGRCVASR